MKVVRPIDILDANLVASAATNSSYTPGAAMTRVAAVQSWPALK